MIEDQVPAQQARRELKEYKGIQDNYRARRGYAILSWHCTGSECDAHYTMMDLCAIKIKNIPLGCLH